MRVPNTGLPLDERQIIREGYRLAERMLANYRDPPNLLELIGLWLSHIRQSMLAR